MSYAYRVYGIDIESEILIDQLIEIDKEDIIEDNKISIKYGVMSEKYSKSKEEGKKICVEDNEVWFDIENLASFQINDGQTVVVNTYDNYDELQLNNYLTCSCLGFIMLQKNHIALHGAAINIKEKGIIITGDKGAGKSSLSTALREKGYKFMADDVSAINCKDISIYPGFPYQKICEDMFQTMNYKGDNFKRFQSDNNIKYLIPANKEFQRTSLELGAIVNLKVAECEEVIIEELLGYEKMLAVLSNIYRGEYISRMGGLKPIYMKKCLDITKNTPVFRLTRPKNKFTLDDQIKLIEDKLKLIK